MIVHPSPDVPPVQPVALVCCCREPHIINAGCRVHGIGVRALTRNLAAEAIAQRQWLYREKAGAVLSER